MQNLEFFVHKGASLITRNKKQENVVLIAAAMGNMEILQFAVDREPSIFAEKASVGVELAETAAAHGHSNILEYLVDQRPTLLAERPNILFKLRDASKVLDTLAYLKTACDSKIENWDRTRFENLVLQNALECDYPDVLQFMQYDVNMINDRGEPLIFSAVRDNRWNIFNYLAANNRTNLTALDREGNNILFIAVRNCNFDKIKYILDTLQAPIDIEWRNSKGDSLLHVEIHEACTHVDKAHHSWKWHQDEPSDEYFSVDMRVIEYLVEVKHANANAVGHEDKTGLYCATSHSCYEVADYLLDHGADPELRDADGHNFWHRVRFPTPP